MHAFHVLALGAALLWGCTLKAQPITGTPANPPVLIAPKSTTAPAPQLKSITAPTHKPFSTWAGTYTLQVMGLLGTPLPESQLLIEDVAGMPYYAVSRNIAGGKSAGWGLAHGNLLAVAHGNGGEVGIAQLLPNGKDLMGAYRDAYGRMGTLRILNALANDPKATDKRPTGTFDIWIEMEPQEGTDYIIAFGGTVKITHQDAITTFLFWPDAEEDYYSYGVGFASGEVWNLAVCSDPGPMPVAGKPSQHSPSLNQPMPSADTQFRNPMQPYSSVSFGLSVYEYKEVELPAVIHGLWAPYGHNALLPESIEEQ